jgi:hypothetical protein
MNSIVLFIVVTAALLTGTTVVVAAATETLTVASASNRDHDNAVVLITLSGQFDTLVEIGNLLPNELKPFSWRGEEAQIPLIRVNPKSYECPSGCWLAAGMMRGRCMDDDHYCQVGVVAGLVQETVMNKMMNDNNFIKSVRPGVYTRKSSS